jgi:hypothetical protein
VPAEGIVRLEVVSLLGGPGSSAAELFVRLQQATSCVQAGGRAAAREALNTLLRALAEVAAPQGAAAERGAAARRGPLLRRLQAAALAAAANALAQVRPSSGGSTPELRSPPCLQKSRNAPLVACSRPQSLPGAQSRLHATLHVWVSGRV